MLPELKANPRKANSFFEIDLSCDVLFGVIIPAPKSAAISESISVPRC
jgi:hypothetical protein